MGMTWKPVAAGVLTIIAGVIGMFSGMYILMVGSTFMDIFWDLGGFLAGIDTVFLLGWGLTQVILGIIAVIGGINSIRRCGWGLPLAGAIISIFLVLPLGIIAVMLLVFAQREYS